MARSKTTTHHLEIRCSRRGAATARPTYVPPASTPPPAPMVSPLPSAAPSLLSPPVPPSSAPQSTAATSSDHGTGSQYGSESEGSSRESPQTEHLEEEQQKSGSNFADENVEKEEESTNEEDDDLSDEETVPVRFLPIQKGKQKIDERSNVVDLPSSHQNNEHPSSDIPTSATHPQLFEKSLIRKAHKFIITTANMS
ncbi:hypothetical protein Fot_35273 [Forsythia ovata]|uniref:Uncharacterized protein n=1 Tax=Forsythia ovata TaxID=205694 RepID=A0ABD1SL16_9LAMI